jgi:perosamine synthetase
LHLALLTAGVAPGDEVIVPSLSFIATANVVRHCGATPVFAECDEQTFNLDPDAAAAAVTSRTVAVMPVHQVGLPAEMDAFRVLTERHGLALVEDAACALGAEYRGQPIGSLASPACFSFHPRKTVTTGEGGIVTTPDKQLADRLRRLRHHGMSVSDLVRHGSPTVIFEEYEEVGYNYRMSDLHAALGLAQMELLGDLLSARRRIAKRYTDGFADLDVIATPHEPPHMRHAWQSYQVRIGEDVSISRDDLIQALLDDGVATRRGVMASHLQPPYRDEAPELPVTERLARTTLSLPIFADMVEAEQEYVIERVAAHVVGGA